MLRISVVTVVRNSVETLKRTLQSVSTQSYPAIEHILIDGASSDGSLELAKEFASHLAHVVSEQDAGIYDAMNKGLALATGSIIVFLNADDFFVAQDVLARVAELMTYNDLDVLTSNVAYFRPKNSERIVRVYNSARFDKSKLRIGFMPAHPGLFVRRQILVDAGGYNSSYSVAGDFELIARIMSRNSGLKLMHYPKVLVKMQLGGVSTSDLKTRWRINKELLKACEENGIKTNLFKLLMRYPRKALEYLWFV